MVNIPHLNKVEKSLKELVILQFNCYILANNYVKLVPQRNMLKTAFINAKIFTSDRSNPWAEALVTCGSRILFCGPGNDAAGYIDSETSVTDMFGKFLMPGIIDSHVHLVWGGSMLLQLDLAAVFSKADFIDHVTQYAAYNSNTWILGGRWNEQNWPGKEFPTKAWVDAVTPETPLLLHRMDYHAALANSCALALAGITAATPDPVNGSIDRDEEGNPTGILRDDAILLVANLIPPMDEIALTSAINATCKELRKHGITSVHDISVPEQIPVLKKLEKEGTLGCRVFCRLPIYTMTDYISGNKALPKATEKISCGSFKVFADGSLGSSTAYFFDDYTDAPGNHGIPMEILKSGELQHLAEIANNAGLQLSIHAIGDRVNSELIDLFEKTFAGQVNTNRHRIEHVQHIRKPDIHRFSKCGLIASVQPHHLFHDGPWMENRIGTVRLAEAYAFRSMLDAGIKLCFGSDFPIVTCNPFPAIETAVNRTVNDASGSVITPEERITVEEALYAYTIDAAYAEFAENNKGSLSAGKLADFIILDKDPTAISVDELHTIKVERVFFDGLE